eukprot:CAMPEP_0170486728 /NCGR_PEP_ID=MMETSP0208-20121228/5671_1 /TAXON_ID=197538 /ORGANISM="Strombidium inclinatum, Strain S3" /LENGTH=69 /DNA_ID=CAMNT_0010760749 /DNA_START=103 /DNA_END=312 /DNA_ORIENTATION=-
MAASAGYKRAVTAAVRKLMAAVVGCRLVVGSIGSILVVVAVGRNLEVVAAWQKLSHESLAAPSQVHLLE